MLNFSFLEHCLGIVFLPHFVHDFPKKNVSQVVFSLPRCLYFLKYWSIYVLQLFVNQAVTSQILT